MSTETLVPQAGASAPKTRTATKWRRAAIATGAATATNLAIHVVATVAGVDFSLAVATGAGPTTVSVGRVLASTVMSLGIGFGAGALVARRWSRGRAVMRVVGGVVALASVAMPLGVVAPAATRLMLALLHLVVGAAFVAALAPDLET